MFSDQTIRRQMGFESITTKIKADSLEEAMKLMNVVGAQGYFALRKEYKLCLPSRTTLYNRLKNLDFSPGICPGATLLLRNMVRSYEVSVRWGSSLKFKVSYLNYFRLPSFPSPRKSSA